MFAEAHYSLAFYSQILAFSMKSTIEFIVHRGKSMVNLPYILFYAPPRGLFISNTFSGGAYLRGKGLIKDLW